MWVCAAANETLNTGGFMSNLLGWVVFWMFEQRWIIGWAHSHNNAMCHDGIFYPYTRCFQKKCWRTLFYKLYEFLL